MSSDGASVVVVVVAFDVEFSVASGVDTFVDVVFTAFAFVADELLLAVGVVGAGFAVDFAVVVVTCGTGSFGVVDCWMLLFTCALIVVVCDCIFC